MVTSDICRMPASIERMIHEENLRFLDNRDVFCQNYFDFVHDVVSTNVRSTSRSNSSFSQKGNASYMTSATFFRSFGFRSPFWYRCAPLKGHFLDKAIVSLSGLWISCKF